MRPPRALFFVVVAAVSCWERDPTPRYPQLGPSGGYAPDDFDFDSACSGDWEYASSDREAKKHDSFPELVPFGCYARVYYEPGTDRIASVDAPREGCGYPTESAAQRLLDRATVYEGLATSSPKTGQKVPLELACELPDAVRRAAAKANARTLRSYAATLSDDRSVFPYAVAGTFGFGESAQNESKLLPWLPGDPCIDLSDEQRDLLDVNVMRANRIAGAWHARVAPLVSTSGGAVHGKLIEAFMLGHLAHCDGGVPQDRILYDPCADHTHTNVRNTGAIVREMGARRAYLVTDDFLQAKYMQEWTTFDAIGGSIDARSLRDFGYLVGSWRQASEGIGAGFWFTPFRFWAEPLEPDGRGRGTFACAGDVPFGQ